MKYKVIGFILLLTFSMGSCTVMKIAKQIKVLKEQAEMYAKAIKNNDYKTLLKHTYPGMVEKLGGESGAQSHLEKMVGQFNVTGMRLDEIITGEPSEIVKSGSEYQSVISQKISVKVPGGFLDSELNFLAVSKDKGKNWFFIDTAKNNPEDFVPQLSPSIKIPPLSKPKFRRE